MHILIDFATVALLKNIYIYMLFFAWYIKTIHLTLVSDINKFSLVFFLH